MRRTKSLKKTVAESVALTYDLFDLPTAQHKAGLAGLVLQIQSMGDRKVNPECIPIVDKLTPASATIRFTQPSAQGLFDDLYAAEYIEIKGKKRPNPSGSFLKQHFPDGDGIWLKLWRDMLFEIPREKPQTWRPYKLRAEGEHYLEKGTSPWDRILEIENARVAGQTHICEVEAGLLLGSQKENAERVAFHGRAEHNLLLHFWPLTTMIFVPQQVDNEGKGEFAGYTLAIPEVADLEGFCRIYRRMLGQLDPAPRGYRPQAAVIDIPQQAGLEFLENLALLSSRTAERREIVNCLTSIEYLHLLKVKGGKSVKLMAAGRVAADADLLDQYLALLGRDRARFRNPFFRAGLMLALLERKPWYLPMSTFLMERPCPFFVRSEKTPASLPWFAADVSKKFQDVSQDYQEEVKAMNEDEKVSSEAGGPKPRLELLINQLVRAYLFAKAQEKSGVELDRFKSGEKTDWDKVPPQFREEKRKLAESRFLEFRSRRDQAFVDHFVGTFCSVKQYLTDNEYQLVASALLSQDRRDDVKALTLLALSANS